MNRDRGIAAETGAYSVRLWKLEYALASCVIAFSDGKPVSTFPENAITLRRRACGARPQPASARMPGLWGDDEAPRRQDFTGGVIATSVASIGTAASAFRAIAVRIQRMLCSMATVADQAEAVTVITSRPPVKGFRSTEYAFKPAGLETRGWRSDPSTGAQCQRVENHPNLGNVEANSLAHLCRRRFIRVGDDADAGISKCPWCRW